MVIQKETRPTATTTNCNIAADFQVSTDLVNRTNYNTLTAKQKELYEVKRQELKYHAFDLTSNAIRKANELVNTASNASHLGGVVAAMGKANEIYRLETNQSTANIAVSHIAQNFQLTLEQALDLHKANPTKYPLPTRQQALDSYENSCRSNNVTPDFDAIDLSVLDGETVSANSE